jgi:hypothetical protein
MQPEDNLIHCNMSYIPSLHKAPASTYAKLRFMLPPKNEVLLCPQRASAESLYLFRPGFIQFVSFITSLDVDFPVYGETTPV